MAVPNIFGSATSAIPLSQLDQNFATAITLGNTAVYLGNTTTSLGNVTLTNVTVSSGNVTVTGANVSGTANVSTLIVTGNQTSLGNVAITGNVSANIATFGAGSNTSPAITTTGDTNTGIFFPAADTIAFSEGGAEAMRIDSSGNVGIGTTTMTNKFNVAGAIQSSSALTAIATNTVAMSQESGFSRLAAFGPNSSTAGTLYLYVIDSNGGNQNGMVINSSGNLLVGATSARTTQAKIELTSAENTALSFYMYKTSQVEMAMGFKSSTDTNFYIGTGSTSVGTNGVYLANTGTSWISNSDERLKENLVPITNAISKVSTLRSVIGNFIADESKTPRPFLIAQDVQQVLPEAIGKSEIDGTEYLGVSYTDTIPLLVAAIKEQQALITALTARIEALETK